MEARAQKAPEEDEEVVRARLPRSVSVFLVCPNFIICLPVKKRLKARQDGAPRAIEEVASAARPRPPAMRAAACLRVRGLRRSLRRSVRRSVRLRRRVEGGGRGARLEAPTWLGFGLRLGLGLGLRLEFGFGLG